MVLILYDGVVILRFIRTNPLLVTCVYFFFKKKQKLKSVHHKKRTRPRVYSGFSPSDILYSKELRKRMKESLPRSCLFFPNFSSDFSFTFSLLSHSLLSAIFFFTDQFVHDQERGGRKSNYLMSS